MLITTALGLEMPLTDLNIEALARKLAWDSICDWMYGDSWWGQFDPENKEEMAQQMDFHLYDARELAQTYADILTGVAVPTPDVELYG